MFDVEKKRKLPKNKRWEYVADYQYWLKEQRKKDKKIFTRWTSDKGNELLRINICPYCKNYIQVKRFDEKIVHKICKIHGIVQVLPRRELGKVKKK